MSAAAIAHLGYRRVFIKRHHRTVRTPSRLTAEHEFAKHLRSKGQPVPRVLAAVDGSTVVGEGDFLYEVHAVVGGIDLYWDAPSWSPFATPGHARAAGRALAAFHLAARDFPLPAKHPGVLMNSTVVVASKEPLAALQRLIDARPDLARAVASRPLFEDFASHHLGPIETQWCHGDWHSSNLMWSSASADATIAGVFDLGLANRTFAVHDLAVALERNIIDWLDFAGSGRIEVDLPALDAFLDGYEEQHPMNPFESAALPELLGVVHLEYALSELEYFSTVVQSEEDADLAYDAYFVGHARFFEGATGSTLLEHLRHREQKGR